MSNEELSRIEKAVAAGRGLYHYDAKLLLDELNWRTRLLRDKAASVAAHRSLPAAIAAKALEELAEDMEVGHG